MEFLAFLVLFDAIQDGSIGDADTLQQRGEVFETEVAVGTPVGLARSRRMFRQDLLARERRVTSSAPVRVATNITVCVPHVISVILVESIICNFMEGASPEDQALLQGQTDPLQE